MQTILDSDPEIHAICYDRERNINEYSWEHRKMKKERNYSKNGRQVNTIEYTIKELRSRRRTQAIGDVRDLSVGIILNDDFINTNV